MTREIKLALILGSALVLVVGALLSDHMSGASRATLQPIATDSAFENGRAPSSQREIIIKPAPQAAQQVFDAAPFTTPAIALNEPREDIFQPLGIAMDRPVASDTSLAMSADAGAAPTMQLEDAPIDSVAAFREWAERQGVRLVDMANGAPPAVARDTTTRRPEATPARQESQPRAEPAREHVVVKGDSFWKLAERYYGDGSLHAALQKFNESRTGPRGDLLLDSRVLIPSREALTGKPPPATEQRAEPRRESAPSAAPARAKTYTVQKGDTLGVIAQRTMGSSRHWRELYEANKNVIKDPDVLLVGSVLKIPSM